MLHITDNNTGATALAEPGDVADTLRPWYPDAPAEIGDAIDSLQDALQRGTDHHGWESYLDVLVEDVPTGPRVQFSDPAQAEYIDDTVSVPVDVVGSVVVLTPDALAELAQLDARADGHYDGQSIWVGGTSYTVQLAERAAGAGS